MWTHENIVASPSFPQSGIAVMIVIIVVILSNACLSYVALFQPDALKRSEFFVCFRPLLTTCEIRFAKKGAMLLQ